MPLNTPLKNRWNQACLDIQTHVVRYPNTCVWKSISKNNAVHEQPFITFHDKLLFAVSIYVYIAVHEIIISVQSNSWTLLNTEHCGQFLLDSLHLRLSGKAPTVLQVFALGEGNLWIHAINYLKHSFLYNKTNFSPIASPWGPETKRKE